MIALGSHQKGGGVISASAVPHHRGGGGGGGGGETPRPGGGGGGGGGAGLNTLALRRWSQPAMSPFTTRAANRRAYSAIPYPLGNPDGKG